MTFFWELFRQQRARELHAKMSKTTNKRQIDTLLNAMQINPDIARGWYKGSKDEANQFWENLRMQLNSDGPPMKSVAEWKKVWVDQKKYVRQKAAKNLKDSRGTGGGPNLESKLSATESAIYDLISMQESVEGVAMTFGLGSSNPTHEDVENIPPASDIIFIDNVETLENETLEPQAKKPRKSAQKGKTDEKAFAAEVLEKEISIQKGILEAMKEQQQNTKKMYRSIDRLYDLNKQHYNAMEKFKTEELAEQKRHNIEMEKMRKRELEYKYEKNLKLIEIQEIQKNN